jgi:hypothetical protein
VHVTLAELPIGDAGVLEVRAGDRQHRVTAVEPDGTVGSTGEQLQHPARAGSDVEHATQPPLTDCGEDRRFDGVRRGVEGPFLVPDRGDPLEVLAGHCAAPGAHAVEPRQVGLEHGVAAADRGDRRRDQVEAWFVLDETEEHPRSFTMLADETGVDEQPEVT